MPQKNGDIREEQSCNGLSRTNGMFQFQFEFLNWMDQIEKGGNISQACLEELSLGQVGD